ncbi:MAG: sel1 repeat family protein [Hyphomicrobiaceae bacterium]|nr:sel1 repeat family protein [Hyphomicrobiaceae bacterium]
MHRIPRTVCASLVAALLGLGATAAAAKERDLAREAVTNLEAYAVYKMGRYDEARTIWEGLAAKGNTTALINLANLFQQGQGVGEDQRRALTLVQRAADLGDARAQYEIGIAYEKGSILGRDIEKAAHWLKKSAEQDYSDGQFAYGVLLATGRGRGLDKASDAERADALVWLRKAKANGNVEAADYITILEKKS